MMISSSRFTDESPGFPEVIPERIMRGVFCQRSFGLRITDDFYNGGQPFRSRVPRSRSGKSLCILLILMDLRNPGDYAPAALASRQYDDDVSPAPLKKNLSVSPKVRQMKPPRVRLSGRTRMKNGWYHGFGVNRIGSCFFPGRFEFMIPVIHPGFLARYTPVLLQTG